MNEPVVAGFTQQHDPGDRVVLGAGGADGRLVGLVGVAVDPVEPVGNQQQGLGHVGADGEFQGDPGTTVLGIADDLLQPPETLHHFFLAVGDFALDLGRGGARPDGSQADDRFADVGG